MILLLSEWSKSGFTGRYDSYEGFEAMPRRAYENQTEDQLTAKFVEALKNAYKRH